MKTIVTKADDPFVRLEEIDDAGTVCASTCYKCPRVAECDLEGEDLLAWARSKRPASASVEFAKPESAASGKKSKTK